MANSLLLWRIANKLSVAAPVTLASGYCIVLGLAAQSKPGGDARALFDNQVVMWRAIATAPYSLFWLAGLLIVWMLLVLWTGAKVQDGTSERTHLQLRDLVLFRPADTGFRSWRIINDTHPKV